MDGTRLTRFRTADDERRFHELYARLRAERWPSPPQEVDIETPLGNTHVFGWSGTGTAVLLVPGWGGTFDPGGLAAIDLKRFIAWGVKIFTASVAPMPVRRRAAERLHTRMILDADLMGLARLANMRTASHEAPDGTTALPDEVLRAVTVPTLALLAEHSAIMDPAGAAARVRALLPDATVEIVPDASHTMPADHAELVATRIRTFLDHVDSTRPADPDHATWARRDVHPARAGVAHPDDG